MVEKKGSGVSGCRFCHYDHEKRKRKKKKKGAMSKNKEDDCTSRGFQTFDRASFQSQIRLKRQESDSEDGEDSANDMQAVRSFQVNGSGCDSARRAMF